MTNETVKTEKSITNVNRLESKVLIQRTRSAVKLPAGTYEFNGVKFDNWTIKEDVIEFLQFNTTNKGKRGLSLGALYDAVLTSADGILGEIAPLINPKADLSGQLVIKKDEQDNLVSIHINNVELAELYQA